MPALVVALSTHSSSSSKFYLLPGVTSVSVRQVRSSLPRPAHERQPSGAFLEDIEFSDDEQEEVAYHEPLPLLRAKPPRHSRARRREAMGSVQYLLHAWRNIKTRAPGVPPRLSGMFPYVATEKECVDSARPSADVVVAEPFPPLAARLPLRT
ncbi:hypothetical protein B0H66DRAFT_529142 [Apodospora peruviana]|uniref:Uncharacterized protein n=1 Tax=Apodospora peruviana TaxID=516989 RepID=A0AAE0IHI0_9PEZI|nr:hypothetical protein B0H66DRAFT_529142 [Apodospora peruviana]